MHQSKLFAIIVITTKLENTMSSEIEKEVVGKTNGGKDVYM